MSTILGDVITLGGGSGGGGGGNSNINIAEEYDSVSGVYEVGDYCIYQTILYKCEMAVSTPEAFDSSKWEQVTVGDEIQNVQDITGDGSLSGFTATDLTGAANELRNSLTQQKSDIGIVEDTDTAQHRISSGQYVIWKGELYTAKAIIPAGTTLSSSNLDSVSNGGLNAVQAEINSLVQSKVLITTSKTTHNITVPRQSRHFILSMTSNAIYAFSVFINDSSAGSISYLEVAKGANVTFSTSADTFTVTFTSNNSMTVVDFILGGDSISIS